MKFDVYVVARSVNAAALLTREDGWPPDVRFRTQLPNVPGTWSCLRGTKDPTVLADADDLLPAPLVRELAIVGAKMRYVDTFKCSGD